MEQVATREPRPEHIQPLHGVDASTCTSEVSIRRVMCAY
jgi:hypothetical protein